MDRAQRLDQVPQPGLVEVRRGFGGWLRGARHEAGQSIAHCRAVDVHS